MNESALKEWMAAVRAHAETGAQPSPALDLYMDQVITFMTRQFTASNEEGARFLTASMINNYVKDGVLSRPDKKRYSHNHLSQLTVICILKQMLSVSFIGRILARLRYHNRVDEASSRLYQAQNDALLQVCDRIDAVGMDKEKLWELGLMFVTEANACREAATRVFELLTSTPTASPASKERGKKEKAKRET